MVRILLKRPIADLWKLGPLFHMYFRRIYLKFATQLIVFNYKFRYFVLLIFIPLFKLLNGLVSALNILFIVLTLMPLVLQQARKLFCFILQPVSFDLSPAEFMKFSIQFGFKVFNSPLLIFDYGGFCSVFLA